MKNDDPLQTKYFDVCEVWKEGAFVASPCSLMFAENTNAMKSNRVTVKQWFENRSRSMGESRFEF